MATPFDKCGALCFTGRVQAKKPNPLGNGPRPDSEFEGAGRLFLVVSKTRRVTHFRNRWGELMPPSEVNRMLEDLGVSVRVDDEWKPYVEEDNAGQSSKPGGRRSAETGVVRAGAREDRA